MQAVQRPGFVICSTQTCRLYRQLATHDLVYASSAVHINQTPLRYYSDGRGSKSNEADARNKQELNLGKYDALLTDYIHAAWQEGEQKARDKGIDSSSSTFKKRESQAQDDTEKFLKALKEYSAHPPEHMVNAPQHSKAKFDTKIQVAPSNLNVDLQFTENNEVKSAVTNAAFEKPTFKNEDADSSSDATGSPYSKWEYGSKLTNASVSVHDRHNKHKEHDISKTSNKSQSTDAATTITSTSIDPIEDNVAPIDNTNPELYPLRLSLNYPKPIRGPSYLEFLKSVPFGYALKDLYNRVSSAWTKITGYDEIVQQKDHVVRVQREVEDAVRDLTYAQQEFQQAVANASLIQRNIAEISQRRSSWTSEDVKQLANLMEKDQCAEHHVEAVRRKMNSASTEVEAKYVEFTRSAMERYESEHIWSVKKSLLSTYGAMIIFVLNILFLTFSLFVVEPRRRKRLVNDAVAETAEAARVAVEDQNRQFTQELESVMSTLQTMAEHMKKTHDESFMSCIRRGFTWTKTVLKKTRSTLLEWGHRASAQLCNSTHLLNTQVKTLWTRWENMWSIHQQTNNNQ